MRVLAIYASEILVKEGRVIKAIPTPEDALFDWEDCREAVILNPKKVPEVIKTDRFQFLYCLEIDNKREIYSKITDPYYILMYCTYVKKIPEMWNKIRCWPWTREVYGKRISWEVLDGR